MGGGEEVYGNPACKNDRQIHLPQETTAAQTAFPVHQKEFIGLLS